MSKVIKKKNIVRCLFSVVAADDSIVFEEDRELSLIAKGLYLTQREYSELRIEFSEKLEVLKS